MYTFTVAKNTGILAYNTSIGLIWEIKPVIIKSVNVLKETAVYCRIVIRDKLIERGM